jgi:hypothetical protein
MLRLQSTPARPPQERLSFRLGKWAVGPEDIVIAILLTACLIGEPATCREHKITLHPGISVTQCLMTAPPHLAKWSEEHPGWHVERWQCGSASRQDI